MTDKKAANSGAARAVWKFFASVKLTIFVLIALAAVSIIGTVVEQNKPIETYYQAYGQKWGDIITLLKFDSMYNSEWFSVMMLLLLVNIVACTYERFPPKWRSLLKKDKSFDPSMIDRLSTRRNFALGKNTADTKSHLLGVLKKKRYKYQEFNNGDGGVSIFAWKGLFGRFGSDITHVSLFVIITGAIIGSYWGYKDFRPVIVGETIRVPDVDFHLRLDKFWMEYYESGQVKQYNSMLTVVEDGKDILNKHIWVNEPLFYKGVRFYQSSYGTAWNMVEEIEISLKNIKTNTLSEPVNIKWGGSAELPGTKYVARLSGYVSDFAFDEESRTVYSKSGDVKNPAVQIDIYKDGKLISRPWLFYNFPGLIQAIPKTDYDVILRGFKNLPYSGLSITKDPGTNIVWIGTGIMGVGFYLAFFVFYKRIMIHIKPGSDAEVSIAGVINKNQLGFEKEFRVLVEAITGISEEEDDDDEYS
ncbi:Cytochrome c-type biogenesis protein Ccs1/ResB [hydrothermal vent metagenome]|uniref:Cytochrome c-type biogenesis protein Ccs1/ResB n=1 Tax=hydrothermal vent metagenome TaxID=652676 RepID=A0A3B0RL99_9ZZZZ